MKFVLCLTFSMNVHFLRFHNCFLSLPFFHSSDKTLLFVVATIQHSVKTRHINNLNRRHTF